MSNRLTTSELSDLSHVSRKTYLGLSEDDQIAFAKRMRGGADAPRAATEPPHAIQDDSQSLMRSVGVYGFWLSLAALVVGVVLMASGSGFGMVAVLAGSALGLFTFMWMLGAIEQRLIQINATLKSQDKAEA